MTDEVKPAKSTRVRFLVWYLLMAVALVLMLPWEAWYGQQLLPSAFDRYRGEFYGQSVSILLPDSATLNPIHVQIKMTEGICRVATDGTPVFSMGEGSASVNSTGVRTLVLDPGAGSGSYEVHLANQRYRHVRLIRWISACVMLFALASAGTFFVLRWEKRLRTGRAHLTMLKLGRGRPSKSTKKASQRKKRIEKKITDLFDNRYLFVKYHLTASC